MHEVHGMFRVAEIQCKNVEGRLRKDVCLDFGVEATTFDRCRTLNY